MDGLTNPRLLIPCRQRPSADVNSEGDPSGFHALSPGGSNFRFDLMGPSDPRNREGGPLPPFSPAVAGRVRGDLRPDKYEVEVQV